MNSKSAGNPHHVFVYATLAAGLLVSAEKASAAYAPAPSPLMTEWGKKVTPENAWREYPRPQMVREGWTNLNGLWDYAVTKGAEAIPAKWDGKILVPFALESSLSGVGRLLDPSEILWYRRTFKANPHTGRRLLLWFEQSDFRTQVFVNGREAGLPHEGGFLPFSYDVTELVREGANELLVMVWDATNASLGGIGKQDAQPHGCMYTRVSGLYGTVWLEEVPETHIAGYRVTPDIDAGTVSFSFDVAGSGRAAMPVEVRVGELRAVADANGEACIRMPKGFKLWSPEEPNLYDFTATCGADSVRGYFGMRKFDMAPDAKGVLRFRLNNSFRYILGTLDQGWWPDGLLTPPSEEAMAWDIGLLKRAGFDMMRKHIKVEPRRYYALCDRLGILVVQDMPSGWGNLEARYGFYRRELKGMIDHLYNVPSIVMWVPYNEAWGQPGPVQTRSTLLWTRRYDPTRLVDGPSGWRDYEGGDLGWKDGERGATRHRPPGEEEAGDAVDRHDYGATPGMAPVNPRRASFLGEFGGIGCRVAGHLWTTNAWGYGDTGRDADLKAFETKYVNLMGHVGGLAAQGLAGSVYTQTTDVEGEINGLVTYDRKVVKFDPAVFAEAHRRVREAYEVVLERVWEGELPKRFKSGACVPSLSALGPKSELVKGDLARFARVWARLEKGEPVRIAVVGGSITQGAGASKPANRYGERFAAGWRRAFPGAKIDFVNAGIGATGSDIGAFRLSRDVLARKPDVVVVEFSVNDGWGDRWAASYEGVLRQLLKAPGGIAVIALGMVGQDGTSAQECHAPVAAHYGVPYVSYRDALYPYVKAGAVKWSDLSPDTIHPNDDGHALAAALLNRRLANAYAAFKASGRAPAAVSPLPKPMYGTDFDEGAFVEMKDVKPLENKGFFPLRDWCWGEGLACTNAGGRLRFEVEGATVALLYRVGKEPYNWGKFSVRLDGKEVATAIDGYRDQWWWFTPSLFLCRNQPGRHVIEVETLDEKNEKSVGFGCQLTGVLVSGQSIQAAGETGK